MGKQFTKSLILLPLVISVLILSGCADTRHLDAGDEFMTQGRYQQAVKNYQSALVQQPKDKEIIAKLKQAQALFDTWLDKIEISARQAQKNNHLGKAQLLYAKLDKHRNDQSYRQKKRDLRQNNLKGYGSKIKLSIDQPQLKQRFDQSLDHITFIHNINLSAKNEIALAFSLSEINFERQEKTQQMSRDYISHYNTVDNPEYHHLQRSIIVQEEKINNLHVDSEHLQQSYDSQNNKLILLDKDRQILELTMSQSSRDRYDQLIPELDALNSAIELQQQTTDQIDNDIYATQQNIEQYGNELNNLFQLLQQTPEFNKVAAYSNYKYNVKTVHQLMTSQLKKTVNNDINSTYERQHLLRVEDIDSYNEAHPTIAILEDPLQLKSEAQLTEMLYTLGRANVITLILGEVDTYQQELITQANNVSDITLQFDQWLIAGSISKKGLPSITNNKVQQQLRTEFGLGGTLDVQELLNAQ